MCRIALAWSRASFGDFATLMPPAFPRPPAWTCAFTTTVPPSARAAASASSGVVAMRPSGMVMPARASSCFAWYSWSFTVLAWPLRGEARISSPHAPRFGGRRVVQREDDVRSASRGDPWRAVRRARCAELGGELDDGGRRDLPGAHPQRDGRRRMGGRRELRRTRRARHRLAEGRHGGLARPAAAHDDRADVAADHRSHPPPREALGWQPGDDPQHLLLARVAVRLGTYDAPTSPADLRGADGSPRIRSHPVPSPAFRRRGRP